jgi:hypothetical protein
MTAKEIYDALLRKPDLSSMPELHGDLLVWHLFQDAYIEAACHHGDATFTIIGTAPWTPTLYHDHPTEAELADRLYAMGKRGNQVVLKRSLLSTQIFYIGPSEASPLSGGYPFHFGKQKWDSGQLILLQHQ